MGGVYIRGRWDLLYESFTKDAYDTQMVIYNYWEVVESAYLEKIVNEPSEEMLKGLTEEQILGCIAWHFRADHFNNGSLINHSIAKGYMLKMLKAYITKKVSVLMKLVSIIIIA